MNEIKALGTQIEQVLDKVDAHVSDQWRDAFSKESDEDEVRLTKADPEYWAAEGRRKMQIALMLITRAVVQPTSF